MIFLKNVISRYCRLPLNVFGLRVCSKMIKNINQKQRIDVIKIMKNLVCLANAIAMKL